MIRSVEAPLAAPPRPAMRPPEPSARRPADAAGLSPPAERAPTRPMVAASRPWPAVVVGLLALDASALGAAFALAYALRFEANLPLLESLPPRFDFYSSVAFWAIPIWLALFAAYRLYDRGLLFAGSQEYLRVASACTAGVVALVMLSFLDLDLVLSRGWLLLAWLLAILLVGAGRLLARGAVRQLRRRGRLCTPALIVGANGEARALAEQLLDDPGAGLRLAGFVDDGMAPGARVLGDLAVLGGLGELEGLAARTGARELIVASTALTHDQLLDLYRRLGPSRAVELRLTSGLLEILTTGVRVQEIGSVSLVTPERVRISGVDAALKAAFDRLVAAAVLLVLLPALLAIGLLIRLDSPGPVVHRRRVLGVGGRPFDAFKFRTMYVDGGPRERQVPIPFPDGHSPVKSADDPRITRIGHLLRRASLDELPQLVNVLRGEMSLVGPRMIAPDEAALYGQWQLNLLTVKPGITGPWQVRGRADIPYEERVRLSMEYIRRYSPWLDLEILLRTVLVVLRGKGAY